MTRDSRIKKLCGALEGLSINQLQIVEELVAQFNDPFVDINRLLESDIISECVLKDFGDILRIHHSFSYEPFTKDKFEYALERVLNNCGILAQLASKGNPGHDISIRGIPASLKTQANRNIKENKLHISKFMELGKGKWGAYETQLYGLRDLFFNHMVNYDRIFSLRCLYKRSPYWYYELVEIPKTLLLEAEHGNIRMMMESSQFPKPGYCDIFDENGGLKFQLYFDGGAERKLQIKNILKKYVSARPRTSPSRSSSSFRLTDLLKAFNQRFHAQEDDSDGFYIQLF